MVELPTGSADCENPLIRLPAPSPRRGEGDGATVSFPYAIAWPPCKNPIDKRRDSVNIATMIKSTHIAATYFWLFR